MVQAPLFCLLRQVSPKDMAAVSPEGEEGGAKEGALARVQGIDVVGELTDEVCAQSTAHCMDLH